ncbi:MAG TPA: hypothetical protein VF828_04725 [Patescibacteria group bacterium]
MKQSQFVVREDASEEVLEFMQWGLLSLLGTRLFLTLAGNPAIIFREWHIAHVLWGGLFMAIGAIIMMAFHGDRARRLGIVYSGLGWGLFIDEIGKYLTVNNDYHFPLAIIFIYISFVVIFLVYRRLSTLAPKDPRTLLYQAINQIEEIAENDLEVKEKKALLAKLDIVIKRGSLENKKIAAELRKMIVNIEPIADKREKWNIRAWRILRASFYNLFLKRRWVVNLLAVVAVAYIISSVVDIIYVLPRFRNNELLTIFYEDINLATKTDVTMFYLKNIFDLAASALFVVGIYFVMRKKRIKGINFFQYGLLINIFLASLFKFYFEQFSGVFGLGFSIAVYYGLKDLKNEVKHRYGY